jgi:hypothetical protein
MADQFDSADFNDPVAFTRFKTGGFGIQNDFAHVLSRQFVDQFLHGGAGAVQRQRLEPGAQVLRRRPAADARQLLPAVLGEPGQLLVVG